MARPLDDLGFTDPIQAAQAVAALVGLGAEAEIRSYVSIASTFACLKDDPKARNNFLFALADINFLTRGEAELGRSSQLSMAAKIASVASLFLRPELKPYVPNGFRPKYELALLYEAIRGDSLDERFDSFLAICKRHGKLTIDIIGRERALAHEARESSVTQTDFVGSQDNDEPHLALSTTNGISPAEDRATEGVDARAFFDLILLSPSAADFEQAMRDDLAEAPKCMSVALADRAIGVLVCPARFAATGYETFLRQLDFGIPSAVCTLAPANKPDISDQLIATVCCRGDFEIVVPASWPSTNELRSFAASIAPSATSRLHLFSSDGDVTGWRSLVGADNWAR